MQVVETKICPLDYIAQMGTNSANMLFLLDENSIGYLKSEAYEIVEEGAGTKLIFQGEDSPQTVVEVVAISVNEEVLAIIISIDAGDIAFKQKPTVPKGVFLIRKK